jgi:hypothetical protein
MNESHDLALIIQSHVPLIRLESFEEKRALELLTRVAIECQRDVHVWSISDGLRSGSLRARLAFEGEQKIRAKCLRAFVKIACRPCMYCWIFIRISIIRCMCVC